MAAESWSAVSLACLSASESRRGVRIESLTSSKGLVRAVSFSKALMMTNAYCVRTRSDTCPTPALKAAFSNSGTVCFWPIHPRSPPLSFVGASSEYFFANSSNLTPFLACFSTSSARFLISSTSASVFP